MTVRRVFINFIVCISRLYERTDEQQQKKNYTAHHSESFFFYRNDLPSSRSVNKLNKPRA